MDTISKYKDIKSLSDLENLYYEINRNFTHNSSFYGFFDSTYLNKQGNLVYFMKMILDQKNISSEVLIFHNKYNFLDSDDIPSLSYYTNFILKVEYDKKFYYMNFFNKWNDFNTLSPAFYDEPYLRIDKDGNIFKEKLKEFKHLKTETKLNIIVNNDNSALFNTQIILPPLLSANLKEFLSTQSKDRLNMIFNSVLSMKFGLIRDFKINVENADNAKHSLIINLSFIKDNFVENNSDKLIITNLLNKEFSSKLYGYALLKDYTILSNRTLPLMIYYFNDIYTIDIKFPENYKVNNLLNINEHNKYSNYSMETSVNKNTIKIIRNYFIDSNKVEVSDYNILKNMSEKINKIKNQDIIAEKIK
jgi:hypothetical protein